MSRPLPQLDDLIDNIASSVRTPLENVSESVDLAHHLEEMADHLIGHFVDQARNAGASWAEIGEALGVTKQAAQKRFVTRRSRGKTRGLFTRFDDDAQSIAMAAQGHARRQGHDHIDTGHILLALVDDPEGVTRQALLAHRVQVAQVREAVTAALGPARAEVPEHIPFTPDSKKVLELSLREALRMKAGRIAPEHILLGLLRDPQTLGAQTLSSLGVDRKSVENLIAS